MSALIAQIVAFIIAGLAILGLVPHQQIQPVPQLPPEQTVQVAPPITQQAIPQATNENTQNPAPVQSATISVPGMSKYTDPDFGFSFWYPSGWTVNRSLIDAGTFEGTFNYGYPALSTGSELNVITISNGTAKIALGEITTADGIYEDCGKCIGKIYFDASAHAWMYFGWTDDASGSKGTKLADVSQNTMGGLHIINGVVPLSARKFVVFDPSDTTLVKTIVATDSSVATPVSADEQIKTIQAEKDAYAGQ